MINTKREIDPFEIRRDFPIFERRIQGKPLAYLDNAATAQRPRQVISAVRRCGDLPKCCRGRTTLTRIIHHEIHES